MLILTSLLTYFRGLLYSFMLLTHSLTHSWHPLHPPQSHLPTQSTILSCTTSSFSWQRFPQTIAASMGSRCPHLPPHRRGVPSDELSARSASPACLCRCSTRFGWWVCWTRHGKQMRRFLALAKCNVCPLLPAAAAAAVAVFC